MRPVAPRLVVALPAVLAALGGLALAAAMLLAASRGWAPTAADAGGGWAPLATTDPRRAPQDLALRGAAVFARALSPADGLGPLYNATACVDCHASPVAGGMGPDGLATVLRVGRLSDTGFDPLVGRGGPVARAHSVAELGLPCQLEPGIPAGANITSVRNAPALFGAGLIDAIPDDVIRAGAVPRGDGVQGRPNLVHAPDGGERVGRFGWKADTPTLQLFVADALRNEHGITSPLAPAANLPTAPVGAPRCAGAADAPKDDGQRVDALTAYVAALPAPAPLETASTGPVGEALFRDVGCAACHTPILPAGQADVPLYSDLLLHDMGRSLDDAVVQGQARGPDWRTTPLWGLSGRSRFLHDGRARTVPAAILAHAGEAEPARERFRALADADREALLAFVSSR